MTIPQIHPVTNGDFYTRVPKVGRLRAAEAARQDVEAGSSAGFGPGGVMPTLENIGK